MKRRKMTAPQSSITSSMHQTSVMRQVYIVSAKQTYGHRFLVSMCELNTAKDHKAYYMTIRNCGNIVSPAR